MNKELIYNVEALVVNYISLKTMNNERLNDKNPLYKYYNDNMVNVSSDEILDMVSNIRKDDVFNLYDEDIFNNFFGSKNTTEMSSEFIKTVIKTSYKLYVELDNINTQLDTTETTIPILNSILGSEINISELLDRIKDDFKTSFLYIINNAGVDSKEIDHVKTKLVENKLQLAIKNENYMVAAKLRDELNNMKKENE